MSAADTGAAGRRRPVVTSAGNRRPLRQEALLAYVFVAPAFVILLVFRLYPVARAAYISLHKWGILKEYYVGVQNYITLFQDPRFAQSLLVTLFYVIVTVPVTMAISLLFAYLLFQKIKFRPFFRTLYFIPYITSLVPAAIVWGWIFNYEAGILNHVLKAVAAGLAGLMRALTAPIWMGTWLVVISLCIILLAWAYRRDPSFSRAALIVIASLLLISGVYLGLKPEVIAPAAEKLESFFPVKWLQEPRGLILYLGQRLGFDPPKWLWGPSMALVAVSVVSIWHFLGYDVVIYLAGLGNVPPDLYEVARIDGATEGQAFRHITLPLLSPTNFFLVIISTIGAFRAFTLFYVMTGGGPLRTTTSVAYFIFDRFWNASRVGYASAAAFVLFAMILVMTLIQQKVMGERVTYQ